MHAVHIGLENTKLNCIEEGRVLTFRLPSYLLWHQLPRVVAPPLDLVFGSKYCIVWYSHWFSIVFWVKWCIWM